MTGQTAPITPTNIRMDELAGDAEGLDQLKNTIRDATIGSRKLDSAIEAWLYRSGRNWYGNYEEVPNFTTSEDAAKELGRRTFPNAMWRIYDDEDGAVCAQVIAMDMDYHKQKAATWPLAIVLVALEGVGE